MSVAIETLITPEIHQPARYLGNELGAKHKPWDSAEVRWALTYPEIYEVGASNLGHIILYNILNTQPRQLCDRAYLPSSDLAEKLRTSQTPLFAVESKRALTEFDILGFSLSYELGATNILEMLSLAGIPLTWQARQLTDGNTPLEFHSILSGGQTATSNPEPYADFFDFFALGDGEELLPEIGLVIEQGKAAELSREALLLDLAQVPGVYVPQFYDMAPDGSVHPNCGGVPERILRRVATPIPAYSIRMVPLVETVHDRLVVEVRRGCTRGCRFCQPGMLTRPARDVEPEQVINAIEQGMKATGYDEFSLLSLSCSDYLALPSVGIEIKNRLKDYNISLSLPSQRVDRFDENIANILGGNRPGTLTFAPEAGTQRMRDIVNKGLTNEELLRGVKIAYEQGWSKVKLYFMIGLPGETDEDVIGIAETVRWLQRECRAPKRKRLEVNLTISNFTPKPHTPFQWHSVSTSEFKRKQQLLRLEFRQMRGIKVNFTDVRISAMEDFVGRGDRRLAPVVQRAWELGAGMDAWWESLERAFAAWTEAIEESGLSWKYRQVESGEWNVMELQTRDLREIEASIQSVPDPFPNLALLNQPLPWDHLDTGIDKTWLQEDLQRALAAATVPDCAFEGCSHCGVCSPDFGHNIVVAPPPIPEFIGHAAPNRDRAQRLRVWFGKLGTMALIGHLDLMKLLDRTLRRADLPIAFSAGYRPSPRMSPASALALGATSSGEIIDLEFTQRLQPEDLLRTLSSYLPETLPIYRVAEIDLKSPSLTQVIQGIEYLFYLQAVAGEASVEQWTSWVDQVKGCSEILWEKTTKSGKTKIINLREQLFELDVLELNSSLLDLPRSPEPETTVLRCVGSYRHDGTQLRPEQVIYMLEQYSQQDLHLVHVHRQRFVIDEFVDQV
ncbi:MAG: TIGR03960 family B12-binding radical SAM protein [Oscillatoriales cyanobacterium RM2_1_1]|nr:TIGR03960 family B12-binding radical SAM protein [Oscillatoriales cyanobacterium RM2_1_1]